jgi:hypothetical protein
MNIEAAHALWREFHATAQALPPEPIDAAKRAELEAWLVDFDRRVTELVPAIPGGCNCGHHWAVMRRFFPPPWHDGRAFYSWTVYLHNQVNHRLAKPWWTPPGEPSAAPGLTEQPDVFPAVFVWPAQP